jgi:hypothetical protein
MGCFRVASVTAAGLSTGRVRQAQSYCSRHCRRDANPVSGLAWRKLRT